MVIYTVHDVVADTWSFPQVSPTDASAARDFRDLLKRPNVPASDLECVEIGVWYPETGAFDVVRRSVLVPASRRDSSEETHEV